MGLFTRPDSRFWYCWLEGATRPRLNTGIPIGRTKEDQRKSKRLAEQVYYGLMADRARSRFGIAQDRPGRTFLKHRIWYAQHVSTLKRGVVRELSMLKQLGAFFDSYELNQITPSLAREWRAARLKAVTASTITREEAILKHLLATAVPEYLEKNPLLGLKRLRVVQVDTRVLTKDEETRLLATLTTPEDRAVVLCALDALLRLSNVAHLTRQQDHGTYLYAETKVGAVKVPISARLRAALDALPEDGRSFFRTYDQPNANNLVIRMFSDACRRAKIPRGRKTGGVSFHTLRHTGASRMLDAGVDVKTVMEIGGWKNLRVLERYLHPKEERKRAAVETIGAAS